MDVISPSPAERNRNLETENTFGEMTAEEKKNMIIERQLQMLDAFHARHAISEEDYERGVKYLQSQAHN